MLELHVLPTEKCNFRCNYCYETFTQGRMRPEIQAGIKTLIARRVDSLDILSIAWFGGEPLVASDIVLDISNFASKLCSEKGVRFHGSMTTNAWFLDADMLNHLCASGVRNFQITLDGPEDLHDQSRVLRNGTGTYWRLWNNLMVARRSELPFRIILRLHIRPSTVAAMHAWLPELKRELLSDPRFSILVKPIEHLGGPNDSTIDVFEGDAGRHAAVAPFYEDVGAASAYRDDILGQACYACRPNAWVIRSDGRLARCTVALESDRNTVGQLTPEGELVIDHEKLRPWLKGLSNLDPDVIACPAAHLG